MDDLFRALQDEKKALYDELNRFFPGSTLEEVAVLPDQIDVLLISTLRECVVKYAPALFGARSDANALTVMCVGHVMEVNAAQGLPDEKTLHVALLLRDVGINPNKIRNQRFTAKLEGFGHFSAVTFEVPRVFPHIEEEWLKRFAGEIFWVGYNWMSQRILSGIRAACEDTNRALYDYIRSMVRNQDLLTGFLFAAVSEEKDFVVLDDDCVRSAFGLAAKTSRSLGRSAADIVLQMMLEVVPISHSVIRDAIQHPEGVDINLSEGQYYHSGENSFSQALRAVWGNSVSCFPILTEGQVLLVTFYMTKYKENLLPLLREHREALNRIALDRRSEIVSNLRIIGKVRGDLIGQAATVLGRFAGGVIKGLEG